MKKFLCLLAVGFVAGVVVPRIEEPEVSQAQDRRFNTPVGPPFMNKDITEPETSIRVREVKATAFVLVDRNGFELGRLIPSDSGGMKFEKAPPQVQPRPPARRR